MKFGINVLNYGPGTTPASMEDWVLRAEGLGFHLAMISDHVTLPQEALPVFPPPFYDPFTTLAYLAGRTTTIELGTTVIVLPYRHPLQTARVAANIDQMCNGRFVFGVGVGWSEQEFQALGIDFAARGRITDEYLTSIKDHWTKPLISFHGEHLDYTDITTGPAPARDPHPPVWVGGLSGPAMRRAARFGDAWHPFGLGPAEIRERLPKLKAAAEEAGRPTPALAPRIPLHITEQPVPEEGRLTGHGTVAQIRRDLEELAELEPDWIVLDTFLTFYLGAVSAEEVPRHDPAQLEIAAAELLDLKGETLR
ncbi:TIGR03619 family F420-dependent LLM class oxidoreductase [Streptomyces sp. NPDC102360]|uniref:TIGR03619 family F420-dependent LLM class oxidoreductase n=1 Tax=Streptomyces sp. NPDC102360 TaxID=3366160 RepID=UPI00382CB1C6